MPATAEAKGEKGKKRETNPDSKRTTEDIEKAFVSKIFDKYDSDKKSVIDPNDLPSICMELDIKPWHIMRYVKTNADGKVTKDAFLQYWFDPTRPKPAASGKKVVKKPSKLEIQKAFKDFAVSLANLEKVVMRAF
ncbi:hypothetical protein AAMO2058_001422600 [Amorphochlora amoebiformis]|eukprot:TRINITY_DN45133_c0_g1_i1.p2 TRINITY_DN45133_c0_g1~~TRINITY_DN45133_c0_g1_i1.p2  ORF type:complete len:142 (+),score=18.36 TRINITY_DN45133_c0_g1_i1:24-428(+)